jgi:hypothetical protein
MLFNSSNWHDGSDLYNKLWNTYQIPKKEVERGNKVKRAKSLFKSTKGGPKKRRAVTGGLLFDDEDDSYHTAKST